MSLNRQILIELRLQHNNVISSMEHLLEVSTNLEKIFRRGLGLERAALEAQTLERSAAQAARRARDEFNTLRNVVNQVFNGVRSLGNAMQSLSRIGLGGFVSTFENTLISRFTGLFTSQLDNAITRFDIMKTFPLTMQQFGVSINASSAAIKKMNEAVIGLPTSLSEIVELSQRFVSVMPAMGLHGDELMSKASDFAIAINNAFLAGGNTSQQAYFAMMQLQDLFTKGELTEREWKSLSTGLQGAGLKIAEYFNYENFLQLAEAIDAGNVSLEQFVDGIIELGTSGGVLDKMARIYQTRLSSVFANIGNAFQRLIAGTMVEDEEGNYTFTGGILGTLDSLIANRYADNENINDLASYIRETLIPRIDELSKVAETWIIDHEDEIFDFLDRLINYDWEGLTAKIADLLALKWDVLIDLLTKLPPGLLAFSSTLMGPVGQGISTIANILQPLVMAGLWLTKSPGAGLIGGGTIGDWAWYLSEAAAESGLSAFATATGALGLTALFGYKEYKHLFSPAIQSRQYYDRIHGIYNDHRDAMNQSEFLYAWQTVEELGYLTGKEIITDSDEARIRQIVSYLNVLLPDLNAEWDSVLQKVKIQNLYFEDSTGYLEQMLQLERTRIDLQDLYNKKIETEGSLRNLVSQKTSQTNYLNSLYEKYGVDPSMSLEEIRDSDLPNYVKFQLVEAIDNLKETDRLINLTRNDYIAFQNQIQMTDPTSKWQEIKAAFEETYGAIPQEVMQMLEEGQVTIPTSVETLATLCQRVIEENSIADPVEEAIDDIPGIIESGATVASQSATNLGSSIKAGIVAGASVGLSESLFSNIITNIQDAVARAKANATYWTNNMDPTRVFGDAFGGRIYRQGGTDKDTVLTLLQPGEYVLRKKAADKLGGDILNKLNNFNFKGAVQALSEKVGAGMSPYAYAGATGNTRIYNNNAQATINVNNATQEFTQRRASKWVRGLK